MEGNNAYRARLALGHMVRRPIDGVRWLTDRVRSRSPLERGSPWMSWRLIDDLDRLVPRGARVFEWGGGGSTIAFLERGCSVTTVESSREWRDMIAAEVERRGLSAGLDLRYVAIDDEQGEARYCRSVHDGAPWDVIVVDGLEEGGVSRVDCIREVQDSLRPGGILMLDDAYRSQYECVPGMLSSWSRSIYRGLGPCRLGVTQTDVYRAPVVASVVAS